MAGDQEVDFVEALWQIYEGEDYYVEKLDAVHMSLVVAQRTGEKVAGAAPFGGQTAQAYRESLLEFGEQAGERADMVSKYQSALDLANESKRRCKDSYEAAKAVRAKPVEETHSGYYRDLAGWVADGRMEPGVTYESVRDAHQARADAEAQQVVAHIYYLECCTEHIIAYQLIKEATNDRRYKDMPEVPPPPDISVEDRPGWVGPERVLPFPAEGSPGVPPMPGAAPGPGGGLGAGDGGGVGVLPVPVPDPGVKLPAPPVRAPVVPVPGGGPVLPGLPVLPGKGGVNPSPTSPGPGVGGPGRAATPGAGAPGRQTSQQINDRLARELKAAGGYKPGQVVPSAAREMGRQAVAAGQQPGSTVVPPQQAPANNTRPGGAQGNAAAAAGAGGRGAGGQGQERGHGPQGWHVHKPDEPDEFAPKKRTGGPSEQAGCILGGRSIVGLSCAKRWQHHTGPLPDRPNKHDWLAQSAEEDIWHSNTTGWWYDTELDDWWHDSWDPDSGSWQKEPDTPMDPPAFRQPQRTEWSPYVHTSRGWVHDEAAMLWTEPGSLCYYDEHDNTWFLPGLGWVTMTCLPDRLRWWARRRHLRRLARGLVPTPEQAGLMKARHPKTFLTYDHVGRPVLPPGHTPAPADTGEPFNIDGPTMPPDQFHALMEQERQARQAKPDTGQTPTAA
jgi:hypothetical protein